MNSTDAQVAALRVIAAICGGDHRVEGVRTDPDWLVVEARPPYCAGPIQILVDKDGRVRHALPGETRGQEFCPGCGAPLGYPPAGPCRNHGTPEAEAVYGQETA